MGVCVPTGLFYFTEFFLGVIEISHFIFDVFGYISCHTCFIHTSEFVNTEHYNVGSQICVRYNKGGVGVKNVYIGRSPMQNRFDSGTPCFSTPQSNMDIACQRNHNKSP